MRSLKALEAFAEDFPILRRRGWSHQEIADHLSVTRTALRKRLARARRRGLLPPVDALRNGGAL